MAHIYANIFKLYTTVSFITNWLSCSSITDVIVDVNERFPIFENLQYMYITMTREQVINACFHERELLIVHQFIEMLMIKIVITRVHESYHSFIQDSVL